MNDMDIFGLERLEDRTLMAVNVSQNGVNLVITGDADDDLIGIIGTGDGEVTLVVDTDGDGYFEYLEYSGVKHVRVSGGDGDDEVIVYGLEISGHFTIDGGAGDDLVIITGAYSGYYHDIGGNVTVNTGGGDDQVFLAGADIDGKLTINTGDGNDGVYLGDGFYLYSDITGGSAYSNGDVDVDGKTAIDTGDGADYVSIGGEIGEDDVELGDLVINTGAGDDFVEFNAFGYAGDATEVTIEGRTDINLGAGDDGLDIDADYGYLTFSGNFSADGGAGDYDFFDDVGDAVFGGKFTEKNFEYVS